MIISQQKLPEQEASVPFRPALRLAAQLPEAVGAMLRDLGVIGVVNVSLNSQDLLDSLRTHSIPCIGLDPQENKSAAIYPLDLVSPDSSATVAPLIKKLPGPSIPYLTTCFDTLQRLRRTEVAAALWNLHAIGQQYVLISLKSGPSRDYNAFHGTVAPPSTWRKLFAAAGFEVLENRTIETLRETTSPTNDPNDWAIDHWRKLNPFCDPAAGDDHYFLLKKKPNAPVTFEEIDHAAGQLLGILPKKSLPLDDNTFVSLLLGHYQEFLLFQPFFDHFPKDRIRVLLRSGAFLLRNGGNGTIPPGRLDSMVAYFQREGISYEHLTSIEHLQWQTEDGIREVLVTAIDSTATPTHLINSAIVEHARAQGIPTFQLQHGIWPHAQFPAPNTFQCDHLLAWSSDYEKPFLIDTATTPMVETPRHQVHNLGCPRFDVYAQPSSPPIAEMLGDWTQKYDHSVLVATNLHWPMHSLGSKVLPQLFRTARKMPRTLFLCKLHPVHDFPEADLVKLPENVVVIDEFVSLYADLATPRLTVACDAVICTLSTVALEAALAGKPVAILETGNANRYEGMSTVPISSLTETIQSLLAQPSETDHYDTFLNHYYNCPRDGSSLAAVAQLLSDVAKQPRRPQQSADIVVQALSHELLLSIQQCEHIRNQRPGKETPRQPIPVTTPSAEKEPWRHLRKYMRSIQKRLPTFGSKIPPLPSPSQPALLGPASSPPVPPAHAPANERDPHQAAPRQAEYAQVEYGKLQTRDEFPQLLRQMGLYGMGIELGVAQGAYSDHLLEHGDLRILFSVDRWSDHHNDEEARRAHRLLARHGVRSCVLKMTFDEAAEMFTDNTFDFIFVDGYAHLGQDGIDTLITWWNKLKPGGLYAGHDYHADWPNTIEVVDGFTKQFGLPFHTTHEDPIQVKDAYPSWYVRKPGNT